MLLNNQAAKPDPELDQQQPNGQQESSEAPPPAPGAEQQAGSEGEKPTPKPEDDLRDSTGRYLGKYKTPDEMARGYKELEKLAGKHGGQLGQYRTTLEALGWTIDEDGTPHPPEAKPKPAADEEKPVPEAAPKPQQATTEPEERVINGVKVDRYGVAVTTDADWRSYHQQLVAHCLKDPDFAEDPEAARAEASRLYTDARNAYIRDRDEKVNAYNERRVKTHITAQDKAKTELKQAVADLKIPKEHVDLEQYFDLADNTLAEFREQHKNDPEITARAHTPEAFVGALSQHVMPKFPEIAAQLIEYGRTLERAAGNGNRRTIATEGAGNNNAPPPEKKAAVTPEIERIAKSFGKDPQKYAQEVAAARGA